MGAFLSYRAGKSHRTNAEVAIKAFLAAADSDVYEDGYEKAAGVLRALNGGKT